MDGHQRFNVRTNLSRMPIAIAMGYGFIVLVMLIVKHSMALVYWVKSVFHIKFDTRMHTQINSSC